MSTTPKNRKARGRLPSSLTVALDLRPELRRQVMIAAKSEGLTVPAYIRRTVQRYRAEAQIAAAPRSG